jgi:hypothetical protein
MKKVTIDNKEYELTTTQLENGYEVVGSNGFHIELDGNIYFYYLNDIMVNGVVPKDVDEVMTLLIK